MAGGFDAERDRRAGIVEVAKMLDVVTVAARGIERTGALTMGRDGVGLQRIVRLQPLNARDRLLMAGRAAVVDVVLAGPDLLVFGVHWTDRIGVGAVEAKLVFRHLVGIAEAARIWPAITATSVCSWPGTIHSRPSTSTLLYIDVRLTMIGYSICLIDCHRHIVALAPVPFGVPSRLLIVMPSMVLPSVWSQVVVVSPGMLALVSLKRQSRLPEPP